MISHTRYTALAAAALATVLLVACGDREDATVGQRVDSTVGSSQSAGAELRADAKGFVLSLEYSARAFGL